MNKLTIPKLKVKIKIKVRDKNGKVRREENIPIHSWVKNYYLIALGAAACCNSRNGDSLALSDINSTSRYSDSNIYGQLANEADWVGSNGDDTVGITVGSGNTAEDFADDSLDTKITTGSGAGQLNYNIMTSPSISDAGTDRTASYTRTFSNNSGGTVTVREIGFNADGYIGGASYAEFLLFRDVLSSPVTMSDAEELEVTVDLTLTYPDTIS